MLRKKHCVNADNNVSVLQRSFLGCIVATLRCGQLRHKLMSVLTLQNVGNGPVNWPVDGPQHRPSHPFCCSVQISRCYPILYLSLIHIYQHYSIEDMTFKLVYISILIMCWTVSAFANLMEIRWVYNALLSLHPTNLHINYLL